MRIPCGALLFVVLLVAATQSGVAQSSTRDIAHQRSEYERIERQLSHLHHVAATMDTLGLERESTDGGVLTAYCAGDSLRLIVADYYGELGDATSRFYFERDSAFFVLVESRRGRPTGDTPYPKRTIVRHERFYFAGGRLTRWVDEGGNSRDLGSREAGERATELLSDAARYRVKMAACRPRYAPPGE